MPRNLESGPSNNEGSQEDFEGRSEKLDKVLEDISQKCGLSKEELSEFLPLQGLVQVEIDISESKMTPETERRIKRSRELLQKIDKKLLDDFPENSNSYSPGRNQVYELITLAAAKRKEIHAAGWFEKSGDEDSKRLCAEITKI